MARKVAWDLGRSEGPEGVDDIVAGEGTSVGPLEEWASPIWGPGLVKTEKV